MRWPVLAVVAALFAFIAGPAHAQDEQRWTDPSGRISLAFSALGWTEIDEPAEAGVLLGIEHYAFQDGGRMRTCYVNERRQALPGTAELTQSSLNAFMTTVRASSLERVLGRPAERQEVVDVDGVAVVDATFDGDPRMYIRVFYMSDRGQMVQIVIDCGVSEPSTPEVEANVIALLQTLRISPDTGR